MKTRAAILLVFLAAVAAIVGATIPSPWSTSLGKATGSRAPPQVEISMLYGTEKQEWIEAAHASFGAAHPEIRVDLVPMGSLEAAEAILDGRQTPTVFSPADSLVLNLLQSDWEAKYQASPYLAGIDPEPLVLTPLVFAAWSDRGALLEKAGGGHLSWRVLHDALRDNRGWPALGGRSDWGFVKLGHTDPTRSNSGLQALVLMTMEYRGRTSLSVGDVLDPAYQRWVGQIERGVPRFEDSTGTFVDDLVRFGPSRYDVAAVYESAAIARLDEAQGRWGDLRIYYPATTMWSDHPAVVLASATPEQVEAAKVWLGWLRSTPMQQAALAYGFRPGDPEIAIQTADPSNPFVKYASYGVKVEIPQVAPAPDGAVVRNLLTMWTRTVTRR